MKRGSKDVPLPHRDDITFLAEGFGGQGLVTKRFCAAGEAREDFHRRTGGSFGRSVDDSGSGSRRRDALCRVRVCGMRGKRYSGALSDTLGRIGRGQDGLDDGRADEHCMERPGSEPAFVLLRPSGQKGHLQLRLEALHLPAEVVSLDPDVQTANERLARGFAAVGALSEQDQPGTGAPGGLPVQFYKVPQRVEEVRTFGDEADGGTFAAGQDECIASRKFCLGPDLLEVEGLELESGMRGGGKREKVDVFDECSLQREDADDYRSVSIESA
nr:hypothetical protein CFP56_13137 [Quercus suber]